MKKQLIAELLQVAEQMNESNLAMMLGLAKDCAAEDRPKLRLILGSNPDRSGELLSVGSRAQDKLSTVRC